MKRQALIAAGVLLFMAGLSLGWWMRRPVQAVEQAAPAQQLPSGATVLERAPDAPTPTTMVTAAAEASGELVRAGQIVVQPRASPPPRNPLNSGSRPGDPLYSASSAADQEESPPAGCTCAPVTLDWGLIRYGDGHRLVVQADGGEIIGGYDKPLQLDLQPASRRWAAVVLVDPAQPRSNWAAIAERDVGRVRLAAAVVRVHEHVVPMVGGGFSW